MNKAEERWMVMWLLIGALMVILWITGGATVYFIGALVMIGIGRLPGAVRRALKKDD